MDGIVRAVVRARRHDPGALLGPPDPGRVGEPSGFGRYGILEDTGQRVLCHECGRWFISVAGHIGGGHGWMRGWQYKAVHGLAGVALLSRQRGARVCSAYVATATGDLPSLAQCPVALPEVEAMFLVTGRALGQLLAERGGSEEWARAEWARRSLTYGGLADTAWARSAKVAWCRWCFKPYAIAPAGKTGRCGRARCGHHDERPGVA